MGNTILLVPESKMMVVDFVSAVVDFPLTEYLEEARLQKPEELWTTGM